VLVFGLAVSVAAGGAEPWDEHERPTRTTSRRRVFAANNAGLNMELLVGDRPGRGGACRDFINSAEAARR
jgi:hypothetical protein